MLPESRELSKRIGHIVEADSREKLLDEIEQFLEDTGLDEEARRARLLEKMGEQLKVILKHLVLVYAFRTYEPENRDIVHWRDIELANASNEIVDYRNRIIAEVKDEDVYAMLIDEVRRSVGYVRRELKRYPQPFVGETFKTLEDKNSPLGKLVHKFLRGLSRCHKEKDVEELLDNLR